MNESIARTRAMMQAVQSAANPQAALAQMLQNNQNTAAISSMLKNNSSLEAIAKQIAQAKGYDINEVIRGLQGGI